MAKRQGYVYNRAGRASTQVTGSSAAKNAKAYATHGKTPEDRARGRMMLDANTKGWTTDPGDLDSETQIYVSKGGTYDIEVRVVRGSATGVLVSRDPKHVSGGSRDVRLNFNPTRGIPSPGQVKSAFERYLEGIRRSSGEGVVRGT